MTHRAFLVFTSLWISFYALSQKSCAGNINAWIPGDPMIQFENKFRLKLKTGEATVPFTGSLTFQSEVLYSTFASYYNRNSHHVNFKVNYLMFPFLVKYHLRDGFSIMAGPQLAWLVKTKAKQDDNTYQFKNDMNKTGLFFTGGIEYVIENGIVFHFRYERALLKPGNKGKIPIDSRGFNVTMNYKVSDSYRGLIKKIL